VKLFAPVAIPFGVMALAVLPVILEAGLKQLTIGAT
jgi:hypothetical protein